MSKTTLVVEMRSWIDFTRDNYLQSLCCRVSNLPATRTSIQSLICPHFSRRPMVHLLDYTDSFPLREDWWFTLKEINAWSGFSFVFHVCRALLGQTAYDLWRYLLWCHEICNIAIKQGAMLRQKCCNNGAFGIKSTVIAPTSHSETFTEFHSVSAPNYMM